MKRIEEVLSTALLLIGLALPALGNVQEKVVICHAAGLEGTTQYVTLELAAPAVYGPAGHFFENGTPQAGHEQDYFGACEEEETTTTVEETTTTAAETTTTAIERTTTTQPEQTTTTTLPFDSVPTTTVPEVTTTTVAPAGPDIKELPFTGFDPALLAGLSGLMAVGGAGLVRWSRDRTP